MAETGCKRFWADCELGSEDGVKTVPNALGAKADSDGYNAFNIKLQMGQVMINLRPGNL